MIMCRCVRSKINIVFDYNAWVILMRAQGFFAINQLRCPVQATYTVRGDFDLENISQFIIFTSAMLIVMRLCLS